MLNYDSGDDRDKSYHLEPDDDLEDKQMAQLDDQPDIENQNASSKSLSVAESLANLHKVVNILEAE